MVRRKRTFTDPVEEFRLADTEEPENAVEAAEATADGVSEVETADTPPEAETPPVEPAEPEHKDIGMWEAVYWRGRPMWRHKRTQDTRWNRDDVWRVRNLK